jgi:histidinol-phosphate aminotransferase
VGEILESRRRLQRFLESSRIPFWPSQANFVLMRAGQSNQHAASFVEAMRRRGILVRDRSGDFGCAGCVRITLGPREHTERLMNALQDSFEERGIGLGVSRR